MTGQTADVSAAALVNVTGLDVAIASLVLLSMIASKGPAGRRRDTSVHDRRSVCIQCMACEESCVFSAS